MASVSYLADHRRPAPPVERQAQRVAHYDGVAARAARAAEAAQLAARQAAERAAAERAELARLEGRVG